MMRLHVPSLVLAGLAGAFSFAVACGGSKQPDPSAPTPAGGVVGQPPAGEPVADGEQPAGTPVDAGMPPDAQLPPAPVTFVLKNTGSEELALNLDQGWGAVIQAWSGKPPKAKVIRMYPKFCTASCDSAETERCPVCQQPEKLTDIRAAQKLEKIPPGGQLEVRWEAQAVQLEKTRGVQADGKPAKCECYRMAEPPAETYSIRACGLRLTTTVDKTTQLICAEGQMTLPVSGPTQIELAFADPPPPPVKGKKKR